MTSLDSLLVLSGESLQEFPRSRKAVEVYYDTFYQQKRRLQIVASGKGGKDERIADSFVMREFLLSRGVPDSNIYCEAESLDTLANFVFSEQILDSLSARRIGVVTEPFHMRRALRTGRRVYGTKRTIFPIISGGRAYTLPSFVKEQIVTLALWHDTHALHDGNLEAFKQYLQTRHP